jgi:pyrroline-5-carboxylate reductase
MCAVEKVATELKPSLSKNHLLISIAAGVTLVNLQRWAGEARVVRVMPNLPCLVGATAAGAFVSISFLISRCTHFLSIPICAAVRFWVLSDFFALFLYD